MKKRDEINEQYQWDLSSLYSSLEAFEEDYKKVEKLSKDAKKFKDKILKNASNLYQTIERTLAMNRILSNLYAYAKMKSDENTKNTDYQALVSRCEALSVRVNNRTSFIVPEILRGSQEKIYQFIDENESLQLFEHYLENLLRQKKHVLSEKEEKILAQSGELLSGPENIFSMLNNADFEFPMIKDEKDEDLQLTHGNFIKTLEKRDRRVRKDAFKAFYQVYDAHKNTLATTLSTQVKKDVFIANVRNYDNALEAALSDYKIPSNVYTNLIDTTHQYVKSLHQYMALRKKLLGVDELHMYDLYAPVIEDVAFDIDYEEAQSLVLESLVDLGEDYTSVVKRSFNEQWIDVYENEGKRSGAYSFGTYDSNPYILMNYENNLNSLFTLSHEMGHSMHSYFTRKNQPYVYGNYSIFVAEVASTTNESLLNDYLLETLTDEKKKMYILNNYLEQFRNTFFRQVMFAEFEKFIHEEIESNKPLTVDRLNEKYKELNRFYYGDNIVLDEEIAIEWARVPHFYYNYYVYQYATGFAAAIAFKEKIKSHEKNGVKKYLKFLSSGSSDYPIDILKAAGVDMTSSNPIVKALDVFETLVNEFENMTLS